MQLRYMTIVALALLMPSFADARGDENAPRGTPQAGNVVPPERAQDFGPGNFYYSSVDSMAMKPNDSGGTFFHSGTSGLFCRLDSTDTRFVGQIVIPHGVRMAGSRVWLFDSNNVESATLDVQSACLPDFAAATPTITNLATIATTGAFSGGAFSSFANFAGSPISDNQSCTYQVVVQLSNLLGTCGSTNIGFYKARIEWQRFIPLAPAVATFSDVPFGSQFYQEVEALVDTGVTAGCTASEFCPGNFVTRLQMAAFLARALGLPPQSIVDPANP